MADLSLLDNVLAKKTNKSNTSSTATAPSVSSSTNTSRVDPLDNVLAKVKKPTPAPTAEPVAPAPVAKKSVVQKASDFLAGAAENPEYKDNSWGTILKNLPNEIVRTILPGAAALNDNPDLASHVTNTDIAKEVPKTLFESFVAPVASFALTFYGATNSLLKKAGANTAGTDTTDASNIEFDIPYLGKVTNLQARIASDYAVNGTPTTKLGTVADVAKYTGTELLNGLYAASLVSGVVNPRVKAIADINPEQSAQLGSSNTIGEKPASAQLKSFQLYTKPTIQTGTYTKLSPEFVQKLTDVGIDMSKYDAANPTFFKFEMAPSGQITGQVVQVKPSYLSYLTDKFGSSAVEGLKGVPAVIKATPAGETAPSATQTGNTALVAEISKMTPNDYTVLTQKTIPAVTAQPPVVHGELTDTNSLLSTLDPKTLDMRSADLQDHLTTLENTYTATQDPAIADRISVLQSQLAQFQDATKKIALQVVADGEKLAQLSTFEYSNGKYAYAIDGNTPSHGVSTNFSMSEQYPTEEAAITAGKAELMKWAKEEIAKADGSDKIYLQKIIDSAKRPNIIGNVPLEMRVEKVQPADLEKQIAETYTGVGQAKAEEALGTILMELDLSQAGYRIMTGTGSDTKVTGVPSTFPKWIPEELRSKALFEKLYANLDLANLKMPSGRGTKQRALFNLLLDAVDERLGVDTSKARKELTTHYETKQTTATNGSDRGVAGSESGKTKQEKGTKKGEVEPKSDGKKPLVKSNIQEKVPSYQSGSKNASVGEFRKDTELEKEAKKYTSVEDFIASFGRGKGGVGSGVEYTPFKRVLIEPDQVSLKDILGKDEIVTVYRGVDRANQKSIVAGDYIGTSEDIAKSYTGTGKILTKKVNLSDVFVDKTDGLTKQEVQDWIDGGDFHVEANYIPDPITKDQLIAVWNKVHNTPPSYQSGAKSANIGEFRDGTPVEIGHLDTIHPIEMPELVKLARELSGMTPKIRTKIGRKLETRGVFKGENGIELRADIFADPEGAAKTLAHEIGHLVDWLPDKTLARGNLLGRLQSVKKFTKSIFGGTENGLFGKEAIDLKKIRNDALRSVLKDKGIGYGDYITTKAIRESVRDAVKARYTELVEATGGIKNSTVKAELQKVSEYWKPYDKAGSSESYVAYRNSAEELYADAISVLFNSPATLEKMAPTFYKEFFAGLDAKPEVKAQYFELQALLHGSTEELFAARKEDIRKGFQKAEAIQAGFAEKTKLSVKAMWEKLRTQLDDANYPILKKQAEAEARGVTLPESENVKFVLQEQSYADNENFLMVENIDRAVVKPIEKAGMTIDDLGEYLLLDRIQKDRADIANPFGFNPKNAAQQMEHIKKLVGDKNFALLQEKAQVFHDIVFKSVEEAVEVGSYNKELFETKIKPNKDSYASFQVVDYMQDHMPATIKGQVGTLKEVANPFVSTILKTIALNRLNAYQRAKNATIKLLQDQFPEEITETKSISTDGKLRVFKVARDKGAIEVLVDGKMKSFDVDPYIAESFKKDKVGDLNVIVSLIDKFNNKLFKPLVTTYNLGFAAAFNPKRDFTRNYKLIPNATIGNLLQAYVKSLPSAVKYSKGQLDDFTRSLVESKAIGAPVNDYNFDPREDELGRILERYGLIKKPEDLHSNIVVKTVQKTLLKPVAQVLEGMRFVAETFEIVSKVAGAKVRIAGGESGKQLAYNLRNFTGTPNYKVRGKQTATTNAIFVFSNIMKEGLKSDFIFATDPKTRSGYWWKTVKVDLLPKFLQFLAGAGVLGVGLKKFYDNVSEYDKSNYIIIPLGTQDDGKSIYMRVPHDENGRLVSVAFWKMANMIKDGGNAKDLQDIFSVGAGQLPSVSPIIEIASGWTQYLSGRNPYDAFHGRTLIDDTTWSAGGGAALKKMVEWTANTAGLAKFATYDTSKQSGVETFMQVAPFFSSVVKISDYGQQEKLKNIANEQKQKDAKQTLKEREIIDKYAIKARGETSTLFAVSKYQNQVITDILGHMPQSKEEQDKASAIKTKFSRAVKRGSQDDPRVVTLIDAPSNNQKREILKSIKADMSTDEWSTFRAGLIQDKIVSAELVYGVK